MPGGTSGIPAGQAKTNGRNGLPCFHGKVALWKGGIETYIICIIRYNYIYIYINKDIIYISHCWQMVDWTKTDEGDVFHSLDLKMLIMSIRTFWMIRPHDSWQINCSEGLEPRSAQISVIYSEAFSLANFGGLKWLDLYKKKPSEIKFRPMSNCVRFISKRSLAPLWELLRRTTDQTSHLNKAE